MGFGLPFGFRLYNPPAKGSQKQKLVDTRLRVGTQKWLVDTEPKMMGNFQVSWELSIMSHQIETMGDQTVRWYLQGISFTGAPSESDVQGVRDPNFSFTSHLAACLTLRQVQASENKLHSFQMGELIAGSRWGWRPC